MTFIDIHILQTVPFANLNRDDLGTPKTAPWGGVTRARVSSQAWKRPTRKFVEDALESAKTFRTRNPHLRLAEILVKVDPSIGAEDAKKLAANAFAVLGTSKKGGDGSVILFVADAELRTLADVVIENRDALSIEPDKKGEVKVDAAVGKALESCLTLPRGNSVALFGRMLATNPKVNVDAAVQVAHALSVHATEIEADFFSAAEDIPTEEDLTGGAHIGTAEFVSATFYRYATICWEELVANCGGDEDVAAELLSLTVSGFCLSMPTGKKNATAPNTVPSLVNIVVRDDRPVSYADAFERPVGRDRDGGGFMNGALTALANRANRVGKMLTSEPKINGFVVTEDGDNFEMGADEYSSLGTLIEDVVDAVRGDQR
jgi:CRISPR system Cascade subunit CasC